MQDGGALPSSFTSQMPSRVLAISCSASEGMGKSAYTYYTASRYFVETADSAHPSRSDSILKSDVSRYTLNTCCHILYSGNVFYCVRCEVCAVLSALFELSAILPGQCLVFLLKTK